MKNVMKKIFRTLIAILILLIIGMLVTLVINLLSTFCPVLFIIFSICILLCCGYIWGNEIFNKNEEDEDDET